MQMVDNLKQIVEYVCENFEEKLEISLPEDVKELYRYKNGSKFFSLLVVSLSWSGSILS